MQIEVIGGDHVAHVAARAVALAAEHEEAVSFTFNETVATANPGDTPEQVVERWQTDRDAAAEAYRNSSEYLAAQARREQEYIDRSTALMIETANTEKEMREAEVPWPLTEVQLHTYIRSLWDSQKRKHDYGTCVYSMSMAAVAAFNYMAHKLGCTGFQASCADLDILRRTRSMKGPFMIINAENALYPQYDLPGKLAEAMEGWKPWLKEEATKKLAGPNEEFPPHPEVKAHWERLAAYEVTADEALKEGK